MLGTLQSLVSCFTPATRRRLVLAVLASALLAAGEIAALLTVVPLMQLLAGGSPADGGALGVVAQRTGTDDTADLLVIVTLVMMAIFTVKALAGIACRWWILGVVHREEAQVSQDLLAFYARAPYAFHLQRNCTELLRTMIESVSTMFTYAVVGMVGVLSEGTFVLSVMATLLVILPLPTLGFFLYIGIWAAIFLRFLRKRARRYGEQVSDGSLAIYRSAGNVLGGIKEVIVRSSPEYLVSRYADARDSFSAARRRSAFIAELPRYVLEIVFMSGLALLAWTLIASSSVPQAVPIIAFLVAAGFRVIPTVARLLAFGSNIRIGLPAFEIVQRDLVPAREARTGVGAKVTPLRGISLRRGIRFQEVSFTFDGSSKPVLRNITFGVPAGTSVALVGRSGAGKTTLADLMMGLHEPATGRVLVDGRNIAECRTAWQRSIGMVAQDVYLVDDSLRANIAFGVPASEIDEVALLESVCRAQLADLVAELPEGLNSRVGERGSRLSGGQRQRIGIARALYLQPSVLVLDEATSALDTETEARITRTIEGLRGKVTVVVIAHRLSTVQRCDQIVFLEGGRVEANGSFAAVSRMSSSFARMVRWGTLDPEDVREA